jgi:hypothetical protein
LLLAKWGWRPHYRGETIPPKIQAELKAFAHKNISAAPNAQFSIFVILLMLSSAAQHRESIYSVSSSPDADTVLYRIDTTLRQLHLQFWKQGLDFVRKNKSSLRRKKCYVLIDETYDSYTGNIHQKPKEKLSEKQRKILPYIHGYKPKNGDTGSFKYLVFALVYGNTRRVIRVKAIRRHESYLAFIVQTLDILSREIHFDCAIMDRGFYVANVVNLLEQKKIPYLIRARIYDNTRRMYGIYSEWKSYDFLLGGWAKTTLVLGKDMYNTEWGFLTNLKMKKLTLLLPIYKKRWSIENIFKATDGVQLRVATADPVKRLFAVCISFILYNLWQEGKKKYSLLSFLKRIIILVIEQLKKVLIHRDKLKVNHPFWNLNWI